jgi:hypothetical protein
MGAALYDEQSFLDVIQALNAGKCYLDAMIVEFF